ncbi:hypothetical protein JCM19237_1876 [Photobacterium aphoticum]|uniref:Uncharacterized protein n=1 Tax=Photobacterium aphoticum TaxID=754436 RepID=A0A090QTJ4_9GAMM|nr:hypothetical protein JCM19237_1876 [Photobacterium aphoticum]
MIVERVVLTMVHKRQLKPEDFALTDEGCEMSAAARKTFLTALLTALTYQRSKKETRLIDDILQQTRDVKMALKLDTVFTPWTPQ